jgi:hypothetical protein
LNTRYFPLSLSVFSRALKGALLIIVMLFTLLNIALGSDNGNNQLLGTIKERYGNC